MEADAYPETQLAADRSLRSIEVMSVPMKNHEDEINGVVQGITIAKSAGSDQREFTDEQHDLALTVASQAAVALTKNHLVDGFRGLFEGLIELIARAIDEKSPYTGDHCRRVPELTMMMAEAACATNTRTPRGVQSQSRGALRAQDRGSPARLRQGLLTPVHVVDKATKLETIHDRIELVELRLRDRPPRRGAGRAAPGAEVSGGRDSRGLHDRGAGRGPPGAPRGPRLPPHLQRRLGVHGARGPASPGGDSRKMALDGH